IVGGSRAPGPRRRGTSPGRAHTRTATPLIAGPARLACDRSASVAGSANGAPLPSVLQVVRCDGGSPPATDPPGAVLPHPDVLASPAPGRRRSGVDAARPVRRGAGLLLPAGPAAAPAPGDVPAGPTGPR